MQQKKLWGIIAEFNEPEQLLEASKRARAEGYTAINAYSPFPINGLSEALGQEKTKLGWIVLGAGIAGGTGGFFMQWFANVVHYPWNIGGRPLNSWPQFMPVAFELTVLCAAFTAVIGMFTLNGLPRPHHPLFGLPQFDAASNDKFFLAVKARDTKFEAGKVKGFLQGLKANGVYEVEDEE